MRVALSSLVVLIAGCGTRTAPLAGVEPLGVVDAAPLEDTSAEPLAETSTRCPERRPLTGEACDEALEGLGCVFGAACAVECVCERGSWVCASDTCEDDCPPTPPVTLACSPAEIDRVCRYPHLDCPRTCRCDPTEGGARWTCTSAPC